MKLQFFGDSYDIIKKSLLAWLDDYAPWTVHPMFTEPVTSDQAAEFARFLGAELLSSDVLSRDTIRSGYFAVCRGPGSVFLDPDTGICMRDRRDKKSPNYIFASELLEVVHAKPDGLALVFDQSVARAKPERQRAEIREKLSWFSSKGAYGFAYFSHAPFICLAARHTLATSALTTLRAKSALPASRFIVLNAV